MAKLKGRIIPAQCVSCTCGSFATADTITIEPFRVGAFPILKNLVIDRCALDRIVQAGGFVSARAGSAPRLIQSSSQKDADLAMGGGGLHRLRRVAAA